MEIFADEWPVNSGAIVVYRIVATADGLKHRLWTCVRTRFAIEEADTVWCGRTGWAQVYLAAPATCLECCLR